MKFFVLSDEWDGLPCSCRHIFAEVSNTHRVIWLDTIGMRMPTLTLEDLKRSFSVLRGWVDGVHKPADMSTNPAVLKPIQIPYTKSVLVRRLNSYIVKSTVARFNTQDGNAVALTTWPFMDKCLKSMGCKLSIYYRVDDFSEFPGVDNAFMKSVEDETINTADLVIASSRNLTETSNPNVSVKYLPHGVHFQHFNKAINRNRCDVLMCKKNPVIGFFGLLNTWIDLELIYEVAERRPKWTFMIIGPSQIPQARQPKLPNIVYTGPVNYSELPERASAFDVALIPFKVNKLTIPVNPLKLFEYFSMGLPVVSTPLPEIAHHNELVYFADNAKDFELSIEHALNENSPLLTTRRIELARDNCWSKRANLLIEWTAQALLEKAE